MRRWKMLILTGALLLSACGGPAEGGVEIDMDELADKLLESGAFAETLNLVDGEVAEMLYDVSGASSVQVYVGSGAVADELALFEFESEEDAEAAAASARARVDAQRESFAPYIPAEVPKLDSAIVETCGRYMAVCVSASPEAGEIISEYFTQEG